MMDRAFSPSNSERSFTWGDAPGWDRPRRWRSIDQIALGCWGLSPGEWLWVGMSHRRVRIG
jgi:hypothetical protein